MANWATVIAPNAPDIVFLESGVNNLTAQSAATAFDELVAAHDRVVAAGMRFVYLGFPPIAFAPKGNEYLSLVRRKALQTPTFEYTGGWDRMMDFNVDTAATAAPTLITNALPDGTHPGALAARLWGEGVADHFTRQGVGARPLFTSYGSTGSAGDYLENLTIGGLVGSLGTGFTTALSPAGSRTPTTSVVAMGSTGLQQGLPGRLFQVVWAPETTPAVSNIMVTSLDSSFDGNAAQYAGKTVTARCYAKATATGGKIRGFYLAAAVNTWAGAAITTGVTDNMMFDPNGTANWSMEADEYEGFFETTDLVIPSTWDSPTQMKTQLRMYLYADVGATVTTQVGCVELVTAS